MMKGETHKEYAMQERNEYISSPKRPNSCAKWLFNEIAADNPDKRFKPRPKSGVIQLKFGFMERSRANG